MESVKELMNKKCDNEWQIQYDSIVYKLGKDRENYEWYMILCRGVI